jgi:hypothetical protein
MKREQAELPLLPLLLPLVRCLTGTQCHVVLRVVRLLLHSSLRQAVSASDITWPAALALGALRAPAESDRRKAQ